MHYTAPTADEIRVLVKMYWQGDRDPSMRARAVDRAFLDVKVQLTQQLMQRLIRSGLLPIEAERRAMRDVALAD
jgi:hypothetical protein